MANKMKKYNYLESVKENVKNYIDYDMNVSDFEDRESLEEYLNETLINNDSVTGNASGSYTFSRWDAEEHICHNTDLIQEATENLDLGQIEYDPEKIDVVIRMYLLPQAISEVLDEIDIDFER